MTDEKTPEQLTAAVEATKEAVDVLADRLEAADRELTAFERQEAREDRRLAAFEREAEVYAAEAVRVQAHRERIEQIAQERNQHFASMAESLRDLLVLAKAADEEK